MGMSLHIYEFTPIYISVGPSQILDWNYYIERLGSAIQKIITIPAALQQVNISSVYHSILSLHTDTFFNFVCLSSGKESSTQSEAS